MYYVIYKTAVGRLALANTKPFRTLEMALVFASTYDKEHEPIIVHETYARPEMLNSVLDAFRSDISEITDENGNGNEKENMP